MENELFDEYVTALDEEMEYEDFEGWEADAHIFYQQKWGELVEYRRRKAEKTPDEQYDQWRLGEAYVFNQEYEKAIDFLGGLHKKYSNNPDIQHSLLDALMAIGKDETAFDWVVKPAVLKLDSETLDYCYNFLRKKRKPRTVGELYLECYHVGYPMFSEEQLMLFLRSDYRFVFTGCEDKWYDCLVAVKRKRDY